MYELSAFLRGGALWIFRVFGSVIECETSVGYSKGVALMALGGLCVGYSAGIHA